MNEQEDVSNSTVFFWKASVIDNIYSINLNLKIKNLKIIQSPFLDS